MRFRRRGIGLQSVFDLNDGFIDFRLLHVSSGFREGTLAPDFRAPAQLEICGRGDAHYRQQTDSDQYTFHSVFPFKLNLACMSLSKAVPWGQFGFRISTFEFRKSVSRPRSPAPRSLLHAPCPCPMIHAPCAMPPQSSLQRQNPQELRVKPNAKLLEPLLSGLDWLIIPQRSRDSDNRPVASPLEELPANLLDPMFKLAA